MAVVDTWDGANRRIYLASGVTTFNPIDDVYREYRVARKTNESFRMWEPFMRAVGHEPKGGGRYTPRYLSLLDDGDIGQVKIVPFDEAITITVTGEVLTEDQTDPFDYSTRTQPVVVRYQPSEAEIISVGTSGLTPEESAQLDNIDTNITSIQSDISSINADVAANLSKLTGIEAMQLASHITSKTTGKVIIRNTETLQRWEADAWEDEAMTVKYGTNANVGIEAASNIVQVAWS